MLSAITATSRSRCRRPPEGQLVGLDPASSRPVICSTIPSLPAGRSPPSRLRRAVRVLGEEPRGGLVLHVFFAEPGAVRRGLVDPDDVVLVILEEDHRRQTVQDFLSGLLLGLASASLSSAMSTKVRTSPSIVPLASRYGLIRIRYGRPESFVRISNWVSCPVAITRVAVSTKVSSVKRGLPHPTGVRGPLRGPSTAGPPG